MYKVNPLFRVRAYAVIRAEREKDEDGARPSEKLPGMSYGVSGIKREDGDNKREMQITGVTKQKVGP